MKRSRMILTVLIPLLLAGGVGSFWILGTRVTPVTVDDAVERFRAATAATSPTASHDTTPTTAPATPPRSQPVAAVPGDSAAASSAEVGRTAAAGPTGQRADSRRPHGAPPADPRTRPEAGVYIFETSGYEEVSFGMGARHDYPDETTVTITHTECGSDVRWDVFEERWAEWSHCSGGGAIDLRRFVSHHEFFGQVEERTVDCDVPTPIRIAGDVPGSTATSRCEGDGIAAELATEVVERVAVQVGAEVVDTVHVRVDQVLTGEARGTRSTELWLDRSTGLVVRLVDTTDMDVDAVFGHTHYYEEYVLDLTSMQPLR